MILLGLLSMLRGAFERPKPEPAMPMVPTAMAEAVCDKPSDFDAVMDLLQKQRRRYELPNKNATVVVNDEDVLDLVLDQMFDPEEVTDLPNMQAEKMQRDPYRVKLATLTEKRDTDDEEYGRTYLLCECGGEAFHPYMVIEETGCVNPFDLAGVCVNCGRAYSL